MSLARVLPPDVEARAWRWTATEMARAVKAGILTSSNRYELVEGRLLPRATKSGAHILTLGRVLAAAIKYSPNAIIRTEAPIHVDEESHPLPDMCIAAVRVAQLHPKDIKIAIEISFHSLSDDLGWKRDLYARAGIPQYWVIDPEGRRLVVHTDPHRGAYRKVEERGEVFGLPLTDLFPR